jgi:hypothetical protein
MSRIFQLPRQVPLVSGVVSPGAKANFFLTLTTTPTDTYTDAALTTPHTNPVIADAAGVFATIYLDPDVVYKLTLDDTNDALIYTEDPIQDQAPPYFEITPAETTSGLVESNLTTRYETLNVLRYGPNTTPGTTDMTTVITDAIAVAAVNGGRVILSGSQIFLSTGNTITDDNVSIGSYDESTLRLSGTGTLLTFSAATTLTRQDCGIFGNLKLRRATAEWNDLTDTTSVALLLQNCYRFQYEQVDIRRFFRAIDMLGDGHGCVYNFFHIRQLIDNRFQLRFRRINSGWCNENNFEGGNWSNVLTGAATTEHITWDFGDGNHFWGCSFEGKPTRTVTLSSDATNSDFNGCRFEVLDGGLEMIDSTGTNITFNGCQYARTDLDMIIRSGAGLHTIVGGSAVSYFDENVPTVVVAIGNGLGGVSRAPIPFNPLNLAPDGSAESLEQPALVGGRDIGLLPAEWVFSFTAWNSGIVGSAETTTFKDGAQSLKLVNTDANEAKVGFQFDGLTVGQDYTLSFMLKCTAIAANAIRVRIGSTINLNEDLNAAITPDDTWINFSRTFTAGAVSRFSYLLFNTSSAFTCFLDGVSIHRGYHASYRFTPKQITEEGGRILGPITLPTEIVATTNVITSAENGKTFYLNLAGGFTSTLPEPERGLKFKFIVAIAPTTAYIITTDSGDNILQGTFLDIVGELETIINQDTLNFVASTSLVGDNLEVESDGTNWYCKAFSLADGGITVAVT